MGESARSSFYNLAVSPHGPAVGMILGSAMMALAVWAAYATTSIPLAASGFPLAPIFWAIVLPLSANAGTRLPRFIFLLLMTGNYCRAIYVTFWEFRDGPPGAHAAGWLGYSMPWLALYVTANVWVWRLYLHARRSANHPEFIPTS